ncbi:MAG: hypothetical protein IKH77_05630 [Clostridia bacterium]|nr:hypothetical protein [Clostridia bacterium]
MSQQPTAKQAPKGQLRYLTGSPVDGTTGKSVLMFFGSLVIMALLYLVAGGMGAAMANLLGTFLCGGMLLLTAMIFFFTGQSGGTQAVNQGEIMQRRLDTGGTVTPEEQARCFHPLKGFIIALLGILPFLVVTVVFALITRRQMPTPGALPTWVSGLTSRPDLLAPLSIYTQPPALGAEDILRIFVRILLLPWSGLLGIREADGFLLMERLSPLLVLLPAVSYGVGYLTGVQTRARVHADIAEGKKKQQKKARREHRRKMAGRGPEQLN